jgi:flagellar motor protein MotB
MPRYHLGGEEHNLWPVVADSFVGILAVVVFLFSGIPAPPPPDPFWEELDRAFEAERLEGHIREFTISPRNRVHLVYSADVLSFADCRWDLRPDQAAILRSHLQMFGDRPDVHQIQIEGHADRRNIGTCGGIVQPYRDNVQLSQNRARAVLNVLLGLPAGKPDGLDALLAKDSGVLLEEGLEFVRRLAAAGKIQVAGFGFTRPFNDSDPQDRLNRRVEILVQFNDVAKGKDRQQDARP